MFCKGYLWPLAKDSILNILQSVNKITRIIKYKDLHRFLNIINCVLESKGEIMTYS